MWNKRSCNTFSFDLFLGLTQHQGLCLGKVVGCKHTLVLVVFNWVVRLCGKNEIRWDQLSTLMNQLEKGMLSIGSWLTKKNNTGLIGDKVGVFGNRLTVRFHRQLLEISWESVHVLVKWSNQLCLCLVEVVVPDGQQTCNEWYIFFNWG